MSNQTNEKQPNFTYELSPDLLDKVSLLKEVYGDNKTPLDIFSGIQGKIMVMNCERNNIEDPYVAFSREESEFLMLLREIISRL